MIVMTKPIQIRNPEVVRDLRALAKQLNKPITELVGELVRERAAKTSRLSEAEIERRRKAVAEILARVDALPRTGEDLTDDDLYDENGLPK